MRSNKYVTESNTMLTTFKGPITTVEIWDKRGNYARGHAKHHPDDDYTEIFGEALAITRASYRYFKKVEKQLIKSTK